VDVDLLEFCKVGAVFAAAPACDRLRREPETMR